MLLWSRLNRWSKRMLKDIIEVRPLGDHRLYLRFEDNVDGEIDVADLVKFEGIFEQLKDKDAFRKVLVNKELGTICWPNGADLDPMVLYARIIEGSPTPGQIEPPPQRQAP